MRDLLNKSLQAGFTHAGVLDTRTIELRQDVRNMCAENLCGHFGKSWSCPPGCGELEDLKKILSGYTQGILVQSVARLEDEFDIETMMETEKIHKTRFLKFCHTLRQQYPHVLALGAGACTRCECCTYPDAPCRFPEERTVSMEAFGMMVSQVLKDNGMEYYYGKGTISFTGCYLF